MKKHTLLFLGLLFLGFSGNAQVADSTLSKLAKEKMQLFANLLEQFAGPGLDLTTKADIERSIRHDFLDNRGVFLYMDLHEQHSMNPQTAANNYFTQLLVLYPNGARLTTSAFETSKICYNKPRDMYYMIFRCKREFSGLNGLLKKEVKISKTLDYQVKIMEKGMLGLEITGGWLAEGPLGPFGLDKVAEKTNGSALSFSGSTIPEEFKIEEARKLMALNSEKIRNYTRMEEVKSEREETPAERKHRKLQAKAERERINREIAKSNRERRSLTSNKINIRLGFGYFESDSMINQLPGRIGATKVKNWLAKTDLQYKFSKASRLPDGKWQKAHTFGLFLNYGRQTGSNIDHTMGNQSGLDNQIDTSKSAKGFMEAEIGFMLREELRLSGGVGRMNYHTNRDGILSNTTKSYFSMTAGISPRLNSFMEMDFNVTGLYLNGVISPRANVNFIFLIKAKRR